MLEIKCTLNASPILSISGGGTSTDRIARVLTGADNQKLNYFLAFHDNDDNDSSIVDDVIENSSGESILLQNGTTFQEFFISFIFPKGQFVKPQVYSESITLTLSY